MANFRIIGADGKEYGPYSAGQLGELRAQNRLGPNTQVSADGGPWQPASNYPELGVGQQAAGPGYGPGPVAPNPGASSTNGFAITGMIMGILSILSIYPCCGLPFNILGLVFSAIALNQIKKNPQLPGKGMATAGLVCSIIGTALLAVLFMLGFAQGFMETF